VRRLGRVAQLKVLQAEQRRREEVMALAALKMGADRLKIVEDSKEALNRQVYPSPAAALDESLPLRSEKRLHAPLRRIAFRCYVAHV